ncbi:MAG: hypothetical protein ACOC5T_02460, partial [Elusimicrobiota bacterium]
GTWKNGTWKNGTWKNGTWKNGTWEYGTWKNGVIVTIHGDIKSTKNPKEYKEYINENPKATKKELENFLKEQ